ncbi:hypothetical protein B0H16DRAFT_1468784 [Mycena metata]|uniref:Uncharacterized protein n=1 Tax=Mycena metata TaxID=1033252 RepID=A0AAD7I038_9AGAR|nr:hypothetical protein B0H16DRAFT_1468784 [Mycena metata]
MKDGLRSVVGILRGIKLRVQSVAPWVTAEGADVDGVVGDTWRVAPSTVEEHADGSIIGDPKKPAARKHRRGFLWDAPSLSYGLERSPFSFAGPPPLWPGDPDELGFGEELGANLFVENPVGWKPDGHSRVGEDVVEMAGETLNNIPFGGRVQIGAPDPEAENRDDGTGLATQYASVGGSEFRRIFGRILDMRAIIISQQYSGGQDFSIGPILTTATAQGYHGVGVALSQLVPKYLPSHEARNGPTTSNNIVAPWALCSADGFHNILSPA